MLSENPICPAQRVPLVFALILLIAFGSRQLSFPHAAQSPTLTAKGSPVFRFVYFRMRSIPFAMDAPTYRNIYSVTSENRREVQLTEDNHSFGPVQSPDGTKIAYIHIKGSGCEGCLYPPEYEINLMNADGTQPHPIADIDGPMSISWSPDRKSLVYARFPGSAIPRPAFSPSLSSQTATDMPSVLASPLYLLQLDPSSPPRLLSDQAVGDFKWAPDGNWVAYSCHVKQDGSRSAFHLCLSATKANGESGVLSEGVIRGHYSWSPDSMHLAYFAFNGHALTLNIVGTDGATPRSLTETKGFPEAPEWSQDGRRIVFSDKDSKNTSIYLINVDGSGKNRLTDPKLHASTPFWSPDGKQIVFTGVTHDRPQVYMMNDDGSGVRELTHDRKIGCWTNAWIEGSNLVLLQCGQHSNLSYVGITYLNFYTLALDDPNGRPSPLTTDGAIGISIAPIGDANGLGPEKSR
jgi:Tol biopolymer transport system component